MDSLTHVVLGAAIGEVVLGKKIGNRALFWGAVAGSLPDADVLLTPFTDAISYLNLHRGITHCLLFVAIVGPLAGWLMAWRYRWHPAATTVRQWQTLFLAGLLSHVLLDACTTYGTPLFLPWSAERVAINNLFIADPLFTVPLLAAVVAVLFLRRESARRRWLVAVAMALASLYVGVSLINQHLAEQAFARTLADQRIQVRRTMTAPTPLNTILWYCVAETDDGYYLGYHSLLEGRKPVSFRYIPRNDRLIEGLKGTREVHRLIAFSDGYYAVRDRSDGLLFYVLKFGTLFPDAGEDQVAFSFLLDRDSHGSLHATRQDRRYQLNWAEAVRSVWTRMRGQGSPAVRAA